MKNLLCLGLVLLLAGCTFPGFDYNTEPEYPVEIPTTLEIMALPDTVGIGEGLTIYADYSAEGELVQGASCRLRVDDIDYQMTLSAEGYGRSVDTGGMEAGTYFAGVSCSKPGYQKKEGGVSFSIE